MICCHLDRQIIDLLKHLQIHSHTIIFKTLQKRVLVASTWIQQMDVLVVQQDNTVLEGVLHLVHHVMLISTVQQDLVHVLTVLQEKL